MTEREEILNELKLGWLSPNGEFIQCGTYEHYEVSQKLAESLGFKSGYHLFDNSYPRSSDDYLQSIGYAYIGQSEFDYKYRIRWKNFLTDYQKNFLKDYFADIQEVDFFSKVQWEEEK